MKAFNLKRSTLFLALALLVATCSTAMATEYTWSGPVDGGIWKDAANWSPSGIPSTGDSVVFPSNSHITVSEPVTVDSIVCKPLSNMWFTLQANLTTGTLSVPNESTYVRFKGKGALSVTGDGLKIIAGGSNEAWVSYDPANSGIGYALRPCQEVKDIQELSITTDKVFSYHLWRTLRAERYEFETKDLAGLKEEILTAEKLNIKNPVFNDYWYISATDLDKVGGSKVQGNSSDYKYWDYFNGATYFEFPDANGNTVAVCPLIKQKGNSLYLYGKVRTYNSKGDFLYAYDSDTPENKEYPSSGDRGKKDGGGGGCAAGIASFALLLVVPMFSKKR